MFDPFRVKRIPLAGIPFHRFHPSVDGLMILFPLREQGSANPKSKIGNPK